MTERLVKNVSEDMVKVIVDYHFASKKKKLHTDTGQFVLVTHKKTVDKPMSAFGLSLVCEGKKIKNPNIF